MYIDSYYNYLLKKYRKISWNIVNEDHWENVSDDFISWLEDDYKVIVDKCMKELNTFVYEVAEEGFTEKKQ